MQVSKAYRLISLLYSRYLGVKLSVVGFGNAVSDICNAVSSNAHSKNFVSMLHFVLHLPKLRHWLCKTISPTNKQIVPPLPWWHSPDHWWISGNLPNLLLLQEKNRSRFVFVSVVLLYFPTLSKSFPDFTCQIYSLLCYCQITLPMNANWWFLDIDCPNDWDSTQ